jgi:putative two-component system response regulator
MRRFRNYLERIFLMEQVMNDFGMDISTLVPKTHQASPSPQQDPYRVLVVDDDAAHRMLVSDILSSSKYRLVEAENGEEALRLLSNADFDVVLMDRTMPVMDGISTCRVIRERLGNHLLPIVMVTGTHSVDDLASSFEAGVSDFIRKPYSHVELRSRVDVAAQKKRLTDQLDNAEDLLFTLARMVEAKDTDTGDHCCRLAHSSVAFGRVLGLGENDLDALRRGGILHDIGKLGVPDSILLKTGPLTDNQWDVMRQHSAIGAHLCTSLKSMSKTLPIIRHHHERWDGGGYPDGLAGEDIPRLARIFQLCDIYDALAHARPYKDPFPLERIISIFEEEMNKSWRDPELTRVFIDILKETPEILRKDFFRSGDDLGEPVFQGLVTVGTNCDR